MSFTAYKKAFPYKGSAIYSVLFDLHSDNIKTKKQKFAVNNLEKIFKATFKISAKIGFHEMSLRDLSRETGLSMGGIYSCIASKDIIAVMVKDMVKHVTVEIIDNAQQSDNKEEALKLIITHLIYATDILQAWFYFLYFETRSLSAHDQQDSKMIEKLIVDTLEELLKAVQKNNSGQDHHFLATMILAMIQERYLKPWKYKGSDLSIEDYARKTVNIALPELIKP